MNHSSEWFFYFRIFVLQNKTMNIKEIIQNKVAEIIENVFQIDDVNQRNNITLDVQQNKSEFEGDFTIVTFPLVKILKKSPDAIAVELGDAFMTQSDFVESYNVVKGFLIFQ